ncbi:MAG: ABC transporter permease [Actinomycetia bacterium]|nr:ABC transporter permease [Actinomycetes bacterium]MCH9800849.1 ABC transporter permease [Actinomycetes bacterium]
MSDLQLEAQSQVSDGGAAIRSSSSDAWYELRRSWVFWVSAGLIFVISLVVFFPWLFASEDATSSLTGGCQLSDSLTPPNEQFRLGSDIQGCDVYSLSIYSTRPSVAVGVISAVTTTLLGALLGLLAGYFGKVTDSVISRTLEIFLGVPYVLGAIVLLSAVDIPGIWGVVLAFTLLSWPVATRMVRAKTIEAKGQDYVVAARALGAGHMRIMFRHILPNAIGPTIVVAVISLGIFIGAEATLSYLGLGIQPPQTSWGTMISEAQQVFFSAPWTLLVPAGFLTVTVLAFIMLGESISDALDPKLRK